ncbi:MAG: dTMP kinase [Bowdeniella nasicola]|nr:dTMP kinase [Bowdeniella nasicola]
MRGLFVTFEGGDGAGKSTQLGLLAERLRMDGFAVCATYEPGEGATGAALRQLIQHAGAIAPRTEALLYAADRAEHVATTIRPALTRGEVVLCDRYLDSSIAYQGAARNLGATEIRELSLWASNHLLPDLTFYFDIDPELARARQDGEPDRLEREPLAFHREVRAQFQRLAAAEPHRFITVDARRPIEELHEEIWQALGPYLTRVDRR